MRRLLGRLTYRGTDARAWLTSEPPAQQVTAQAVLDARRVARGEMTHADMADRWGLVVAVRAMEQARDDEARSEAFVSRVFGGAA